MSPTVFSPAAAPSNTGSIPPIADRKALAQVTRPGYEPMYGEFIGFLEPAPEEGFAAAYDGRFNVKQINLISSEMLSGCQRPPHATRSFGNEPGWVVELDAIRPTCFAPPVSSASNKPSPVKILLLASSITKAKTSH